MKLKTLVKLLMVKERRPDLIIHVNNHEYELGIYDYLLYKDKEVLDWTYINVDALENDKDKIIIYISQDANWSWRL